MKLAQHDVKAMTRARFSLVVGLLTLSGLGMSLARSTEPSTPGSASLEVVRIGEMSVERATHQATLLATGQVLVTGGCAGHCDQVLSSAELYDPATSTFSPAPDMATPRAGGEAVALPDGRVLVTGGWTGRHVSASAEIYDPDAGRWTSAGEMMEARMSHSVVPLQDGRVLVVGGETRTSRSLASAEVFDPASSTFSAVSSMQTPRASGVAVALADGRVLVTGGHQAPGEVVGSAEIFDPATGEFHATGDLAVPRHKHAAVLLHDERVFIIGGSDARDGRGRKASTEYYDPETGEFSHGPDLRSPRHKLHDAVLTLRSGAVLVAGGSAHAEVWDPADREFVPVRGQLDGRRDFTTATFLPTGEVLLLGGYGVAVQSSASAWLIRRSR